MGAMPAMVAWSVLWPALLPWLAAATLPLILAAWPLRHPQRVGWAATDLVAAAARRAGLGRRGIPLLLVALRTLACGAIALAASRPFLAAPPPGVPVVAGLAERRIEIVSTAPRRVDVDPSLAIRHAVAALAATPSALAERGMPTVDAVELREAAAPFAGRRLIVLCDGAVPTAADGSRIAAAVRAGSGLLVCLGPDSAGSARLAAWLRDLASLDVEGAIPLDDAAIDAGGLAATGSGSMLEGPTVETIAGVSFTASQWNVWARTVPGGRPLVMTAAVGRGQVCVATIPLTVSAGDLPAAGWSDLPAWPAFLPFVDRLFSRLLDPEAEGLPAASVGTTPRFTGPGLARLLVGIAAAAAAGEWLTARRFSGAPPAWISRSILLALCAGMFMAWGERPRERPTAPDRPQPVTILVDTSPSMATLDVATPAGPQTRLQAVQEALDSTAVGTLSRNRAVRLATIDDHAPESPPAFVAKLADLAAAPPAAHASRLGDAVARLAEAAEPPAAIVVASDGAISDGLSWEEVGRILERCRVPLVAVPVGGTDAADAGAVPFGFRFNSIDAPLVCQPDDRLVAVVHATASVPHAGRVALVAEHGAGDLAAVEATPQGPFAYHFAGECSDRVRADGPTMQTRAMHTAGDRRHTATYPVMVTAAAIRVLLVDTLPRFEFRFLERLLAGSQQFALDSCLLGAGATDGMRPTARLPAAAADWLAYDVVVIGDVPIAAASDDAARSWAALREAAERDSVGIAWIPGRRWAGDDSGLTSWMPAAPAARSVMVGGPRSLALAPAGLRPGWFLFPAAPLPGAGPSALQVFSVLDAVALMPTARVVATARAAADGADLPAVVTARLGAATIVGHFCETWRWRDADGGDAHARYWTHLLTRLAAPRRVARLTPATIVVRPCDPVAGETVWIDAVPSRHDSDLTGWAVEVTGTAGSPRQLALPDVPPGAAATIPLAALGAGRHTVRLVPPKNPDTDPPQPAIVRDIVVNEPVIERPGGPAGTGPLAAAALASGGAVVPPDEIDKLPATIERLESLRWAAVALAGPRWFETQGFAHLLVAAAVAAGVAAWWPRERGSF